MDGFGVLPVMLWVVQYSKGVFLLSVPQPLYYMFLFFHCLSFPSVSNCCFMHLSIIIFCMT